MTVEASNALARLSVSSVPGDAKTLNSGAGAKPTGVRFAAATPEMIPYLAVLRNIATYHREHERYYAASLLADAAELARDANRLKVIAGVWLAASPSAEKSQIDYSDPLYQAAGCEDLNALNAISAIGILFMEAQAEPAESAPSRRCCAVARRGLSAAGQWLAEKAEAVSWHKPPSRGSRQSLPIG